MALNKIYLRIKDQVGIGSGLGTHKVFVWLSVSVSMLALLFALSLQAATGRAARIFISLQGAKDGHVLQPSWEGRRAAQRQDLKALRQALPGIPITGSQFARMTVSSKAATVDAIVIAGDSWENPASRDERLRLIAGSWLDEDDDRAAATVCVLSRPLATVLFPHGNAVGRALRIGHVPFRVKGVMADRAEEMVRKTGLAKESKWFVVRVPLTTGATRLLGTDRLSELSFRSETPEVTAARIRELLRQMGRDADRMSFQTPAFYWKAFQRSTRTMRTIAFVLGFTVLLLGGGVTFNVFNVFLDHFSAELLLRRALGATVRRIRADLVLGVVMLALPGAAFGLVLGVAAAPVLRGLDGLPPMSPLRFLKVGPAVWLPAAVMSLAVTAVAALISAWRATRRAAGGLLPQRG